MCTYTWKHVTLHTYEHPYKNACMRVRMCTHTYTGWGGQNRGCYWLQEFCLLDYIFIHLSPSLCRIPWLWYHLAHLLPLLIPWFWCHAHGIYANANVMSHFPWVLFYLFCSIVHLFIFAPFRMFYMCYRVGVPFYPSCGFSVYSAPFTDQSFPITILGT